MCGVVGIINKEENIAERLVKFADLLQNRGTQSTKVYTYDSKNNVFHTLGGLGPADIVIPKESVNSLSGNLGIAHTRYATAGRMSKEMLTRNMQPVYSSEWGFACCANGDLVNLFSKRKALEYEGFHFNTEVDVEVIHKLLVKYHFNQQKSFFETVKIIHDELIGAYSTVCLFKDGIGIFKDPCGIRPLCMAKRKEKGEVIEICFSSESSTFDYFGDYEDITDINPGEAVFVDTNLEVKSEIISSGKEAFCFFEFVYFAKPNSKFYGRRVECVREELGKLLAIQYAHMKENLDCVIGVPDSGVSAGIMFAKTLDLPYKRAIIKTKDKRSFLETSQEKRKEAIKDKFIFIDEFIKGKKIAIIDDSNVRGNTAKKMVEELRNRRGAKEVHLFYFSPPIKFPCYYGIDIPQAEELIAANYPLDKLSEIIGANSVNYISIENLIKGISLGRSLCLACVSGNYPTSISEAKERQKLRAREREEATQKQI